MPPNPGFASPRDLDPADASAQLDAEIPTHIERERARAAKLRQEAQSWRGRANALGNPNLLQPAQEKERQADRCELRARVAEESGRIVHGQPENQDREYLDATGYQLIRLARACKPERIIEMPVAPLNPQPAEKAKVTA
jgi:hypothetical protein